MINMLVQAVLHTLLGESDYAVVGLSSHVITGRDTSLPVKDQLADAQHYLSTKKPNNFTFTYDVG